MDVKKSYGVIYNPMSEINISERCPDCGESNCLTMTLYQKEKRMVFYHQMTKKVSGTLYCNHTKEKVHVVLWNERFENIFRNGKSKLILEPRSFKFNRLFYIMVTVIALIIGSFFAFSFFENSKQSNLRQSLENVEPDLKMKIMFTLMKDGKQQSTTVTWFVIKKVESDTVWAQQHKLESEDMDTKFDLANENFNGEIRKVSKTDLKTQGFYEHDKMNLSFAGFVTETSK